MKLQKVHIQNFRGIKDIELDLGDLVVLIGENNSGKTAILHAIRLCLRDLGPRRRVVFDPFDFHLQDGEAEPSGAPPISIKLTFAEESAGEWEPARLRRLKDVVSVDAGTGLTHVVLRVTCAYDPVDRDFNQSWDFLNEAGQPLPGRGDGAIGALQREVAFYLLDALRDAGRNFDARGQFWRPFLKDSQLPAERKAEIEAKLKEVNELVVSSHGSFDQLCDRLSRLQDIVPMQSGETVSVEAVPGRMFDMLTKAQVHLGTTTGAKVPVGRHGEGTQSLAVLMLFAAFLDLDASGPGKERQPLVALEEPEAHLHPSAVRTLWRSIEGIPGQKLISTHSGDLLSQVPVSAIRRLVRGKDGVKAFRLNPGTLDARDQRMFDFHIRHGRGELLFARCWLFGEGETEITLFHEIARHLDIDLERSGVRCVPYRLGASIELFLKVADDLGIRWCALTDNDQQGRSDQQHLARYCDPQVLSDVVHVMPENDIESHLCSAGFGPVYEAYLTEQLRPRVTVAADHPDYWQQVLGAIKGVRGFKPTAALKVAERIHSGNTPAPPLLRSIIENAVALAGVA